MNLLWFNQNRLTHNAIMYEKSFVPENHPAYGGFSVMKFTLENLYSMFQDCTNWWTNSNTDLPLCRYIKCRLKLYQSEKLDYVVKFNTTLPGNSNKLTYPSTQSSIILMSKDKVIVPSKETKPLRKPYKILNLHPPQQLENRWYFQRDLLKTPLVTLYAAGVSLKNYYVNPEWDNNNITLTHLNTQVINNRNFTQENWPYTIRGTIAKWLLKDTNPDNHENNIMKQQIQYIVPLTNLQYYTIGDSYHDAKITYHVSNFQSYKTNLKKWAGNPLVLQNYEKERSEYYTTDANPIDIFTQATSETETLEQLFVKTALQGKTISKFTEPLILKSRYNPIKDNGTSTNMYLLNVTKPGTDWNAPSDLDTQLGGFPLWINIWGYVDFQKKLGKIQEIDTKNILVFTNNNLDPKRTMPIVLIDTDYLNDRSPYSTSVHPDDYKKWYPQLQYQEQEINKIAACGLGVPKLPDKTCEQITIKYDFQFKWGGNPAKMVTVENPIKQTIYPVPSNEQQTTSLQSPAQAIESLLYTFDERDHQLTATAMQRIQKDWMLTETLSPFTETTKEVPAEGAPQTKTTTKESEETLQQQLQLHRQQQLQLRLRILQLMQTMNM